MPSNTVPNKQYLQSYSKEKKNDKYQHESAAIFQVNLKKKRNKKSENQKKYIYPKEVVIIITCKQHG